MESKIKAEKAAAKVPEEKSEAQIQAQPVTATAIEVKFAHHTWNQVVLRQIGCEGRKITVFVDDKYYGEAVAIDELVIIAGGLLKISGHTFTWEVE